MAYKTTCPQCLGHNFYVTEHNGLKYCFNCGYVERDGRSVQPRIRCAYIPQIRSFYTEMTRYYHACLTRAAYDYLRSRGITDAMIDSLQIGYVPDEPNLIYTQPIAQYAGVAKDGKSLLAGCVTFPYWQDDSVYNLRGRKITEKQYMSPYHSAYYRGADIIFRTDQAYHDTIILTESEIKAIASTQVGMPAYGFAGTNSSAVYVQYPRQTIIICFDNQRNHRRQLIQSIHRVAQRYTNVLIATLPLYGQEKQDIDDFIAQYGASEYRKVIQSALPYEQWSALIR